MRHEEVGEARVVDAQFVPARDDRIDQEPSEFVGRNRVERCRDDDDRTRPRTLTPFFENNSGEGTERCLVTEVALPGGAEYGAARCRG